MEKPKIILSKCFSYPTRYNGGIVKDDFIERLKEFVDYELVCPEMEIGLGVPRPKIIILMEQKQKRLFQPETNRDLTGIMKEYANGFLEKIKDIDGFVLKSKSPSCGLGSANYYQDNKIVGRTDGFFAEAVKKKFSDLPIETEGRLKNIELREHFLIRIFSFAEFRRLKSEKSARGLVDFHTRYKYLIMTYSQKNLKQMGKIVADGNMKIDEKFERYEILFYDAFKRKPSRARHFNTILHIFGHFSTNLNANEKKHFQGLLEKYKRSTVELRTIIEILRNFAFRFDDKYLLFQKYLNPFPEDLLESE